MPDFTIPGVQVQNPLQLLAQAGQIRAQQQQADEAPLRLQALQQGVQSGGLQLQQQQQAAADQKAMTAAWGEYDGKDPSQLPKLIVKYGGSGQAAQAVQAKLLEQRKTLSEIAAQDATTGSKNIETKIKTGDAVAGALSPLTDPTKIPDAQLPAALTSTVQDLTRQGLLDPQHAQAATALLQSGDPNQIRQGIGTFSKTLLTQSQIAKEEKDAADAANQKAERAQAALNAQQTAAHNAVEEKQGSQRIGLEAARLKFDKDRQGTQDSQAIETQAQQIASGEVKGLSQARNNPFARSVMARVYEINPKYSDSLYTATQDLRSSKPNSSGANVTRLGTAILHADNALKSSGDLGFSEGLLTGVGTAGVAQYRQDAEFLTGEIGQYVTGGKLTVDEGKKLSTDLMSARQGVRDSALHEVIKLSGGKLKSQMEQYKNATGNDFPTDRVFNNPEISGALVNHGVINANKPSGAQAAPPPGATHTVPGSDGRMHYTDGKNDLGVVQ